MAELNVKFGGYSNQGVKEENQDALAAFQPQGSALQYKGMIGAIADGVSTAKHAKEASNTCVTNFILDYLETPDTWTIEKSAAHIIRSLNTWCCAQDGPQLDHAAHNHQANFMTTLSVVIFLGKKAYVFHIGDSRVYRYQGGQVELLTRDHKQNQGGHSYLTRAIGIDPHVDVDLSVHDVEEGDLWLLSTDGLHDFLTKKEIESTLAMRHISLEAKAQDLANKALSANSDDNVSCLVLKVDQLPLSGQDEFYEIASKLVIPPPMKEGNKIDRYRIQEVLFEGTRSHVYKVLCLDSKNTYALKTPSQHYRDDELHLKSFIQEQWIGQRIEHENMMRILPRTPGSQFLYHVCELIEGQTLRQWMVDHPQPSLEKVRSIINPVVSALRKMQRLDLIHRDLKPENIMITLEGKVKLVDFGTIQAASIGQNEDKPEVPLGSVNYVAPETVLNNTTNHVSDIFSLGVIVYEMLANELPFKPFAYKDYQAKSLVEWKYIPLHKTSTDLPNWVDMALKKACAPNPTNRYDSFSEFVADLTHPNEAHLNAIKNAPLIERNPLRFWQISAGLLFLINLIQLVLYFA